MGGESWCTDMVQMGGESWCTYKDLQTPFSVLKTEITYFSKLIDVVLAIFYTLFTYFSNLLKLRFLVCTFFTICTFRCSLVF